MPAWPSWSIVRLDLRHVAPVFGHRDGGDADVLVVFEEQHGARPPAVGNAIPVRCAADHRPTGDLAVMLTDQLVDGRFDHRKVQADATLAISEPVNSPAKCSVFTTSCTTRSSVRPVSASVDRRWRMNRPMA